jgi:hypothetical protein
MDPLTTVRAIHFAATILVAGAAAFSVLVGEPVWQPSADAAPPIVAQRGAVAYLMWVGLATTLASGIAWLALVAAEITGGSWADAIRDGTAYAVLTDTQFGFIGQLRLLLAVALAGLLLALARQGNGAPKFLRIVAPATGPPCLARSPGPVMLAVPPAAMPICICSPTSCTFSRPASGLVGSSRSRFYWRGSAGSPIISR